MKTAHAKKPKAPPVIREYLGIDDTLYLLTNLSPNPVANPSIRLTKASGEHYDCSTRFKQNTCTCPDYIIRRERYGDSCKHLLALEAVGKLPNFGGHDQ